MTGPEIAAVGKVLEVAGKKAFAEDDKTKEHLLDAAQETPEFKAAARSMAARLAVKERVRLKLWQPFARMVGVSRAYFEEVFPEEMADKTAEIPDEHLITPPASVAVPAMLGLSYSFEEPDLKVLYLNLLTTASDDRRAADAHPAFVEVIKQLTPAEARLLNYVLRISSIPMVRINHTIETGGYRRALAHLVNVVNRGQDGTETPSVIPQLATWIDNWVRLGLVEATYLEYTLGEGTYDWVKTRPEYARLNELHESRVAIDQGVLYRTAFGEQFFRAVSQFGSDVEII